MSGLRSAEPSTIATVLRAGLAENSEELRALFHQILIRCMARSWLESSHCPRVRKFGARDDVIMPASRRYTERVIARIVRKLFKDAVILQGAE